ncbi:MAG: glycosyltransferase family protein [Firmicutes bacterium]|nr:glycosyltransferase family protein [Bacillota bacterium]
MSQTVCIIQARMGSTRLPGKVLKDLSGKTVLEHLIDRVKQSKHIDEIVIATTLSEKDNAIVSESNRCGVRHFRGSEDDVLGRYYYAAKETNADTVLRITSDCPLIDPQVIDAVVAFYHNNHYSIVTNAGNDLNQRTYPRGLDLEVFSFESLQNAFYNAKEKYQREHVTPYIYENVEDVFYFKNNIDYSRYRWTVDTEEDFELISMVYKFLYKGRHDFYFNDILELFEKHPELVRINEHVEQKKLKS